MVVRAKPCLIAIAGRREMKELIIMGCLPLKMCFSKGTLCAIERRRLPLQLKAQCVHFGDTEC